MSWAGRFITFKCVNDWFSFFIRHWFRSDGWMCVHAYRYFVVLKSACCSEKYVSKIIVKDVYCKKFYSTWITCRIRIKTKNAMIIILKMNHSQDRFKSVSGTYLTPNNRFRWITPSKSLSNCSKYWSPSSGPTGHTILPPFLSWSSS